MNKHIDYGSACRVAVMVVGGALLASCSTVKTERAVATNGPSLTSPPVVAVPAPPAALTSTAGGEKYTPSLLSPPAEVDQSVLNRRLQTARKDMAAFLSFAENFRKNGDLKALEQLRSPVDDYLTKHVDNLLVQGTEHSPLETTRVTAEILFIKARLFMSLDRRDEARNTVADMKKRFSSYQKISVEFPGKATTLDEGIRLLDEELAKVATAEKK